MYLTQCLHRMVRQAPDSLAAVDADGRLSWRDLTNRVARFAGALHEAGLQPGDRVAMLARNSTDFLVYLLGTWWAGGVINPVNLRWTPGEIGYSLENCQTRILIVDPAFASLVDDIRAASPNLRHVVQTGEIMDAWIERAQPMVDVLRQGDDLAAILYTGGTTGFPKGVMLSHANLAASMLGSIAAQRAPAGQKNLHVAPLFHVGALSGLLIALFSGTASHFRPAFEPLAVMEAIAQEQIDELFLVPTMIRMVLDHPRFGDFDMRLCGKSAMAHRRSTQRRLTGLCGPSPMPTSSRPMA
ncbi:MAG: AMP-binding protein [Rhizorhabdus sp.]